MQFSKSEYYFIILYLTQNHLYENKNIIAGTAGNFCHGLQ
jgi:hypothetical protein